MKKLILAAILFSSVTFAQVPQPQCRKGNLAYADQQHVIYDFCVVRLKATSPVHCNIMIKQLGDDGVQKEYSAYLKQRKKEICGNK